MTWNGKGVGQTGKGSAIRSGLDKEQFEENMERLRKSPPVSEPKEVIKIGNKTTYKY
mgnify:CR=1 FL=1